MRKKFLLSKFLVLLILITGSVGVASAQIAKIGGNSYSTFAAALTAANNMTGDVIVEIYGAGEFTDGMELNGSYTSIKFIGKNAEAKLTVNQTAGGDYLGAHGKTVSFTDLILDKANPAWSGNSAHMGNYFSLQGGTATYNECIFPNGACTSGGTATYTDCTFQNISEYGLWVYDDALVTVNGGTIDSKKGIKVYSEDEGTVTSTLTVRNATFTENVTAKPAVAVGYAQSITLIGNTYNNPTDHVELDSGSDADCEGITFVAEDAEGNDIASTLKMTDRANSQAPCGVLCDGKIYTTVAQAAEDATPGSTVTLLYNSTETVTLPAGVTLDTNGYTADGVTEAAPDLTISTAQELINFAKDVNENANKYEGKVVALGANINLNGNETNLWTPIGKNGDSNPKFKGTFDGKGYTISNLYVKQEAAYHAAGLFGATNGTIKNFTIDGAYVESLSSGNANGATVNGTAVVAGSTAYGATIENVHVKNATVKGNRYVAGIVGYMDGVVKGCSVENVTIVATPDKLSGSYDNGDKVGGIVGYTNSGATEIASCELKGTVSIKGYRDIGGIVGTVHSSVVVSDNTNSATVSITVDQNTGYYGDKDANAGEFIGRGTANSASTDNTTAEGATYTVETIPYTPVASVNGTNYTDIQEAIKAAAPSGTVEILSDVTVDKWIMFSETLNISSGQIITMDINGLTINGNNKAITIKSIESASNGNRLFYDATNLNIKNLTINCTDAAANQGGIGLTSGTIENVTFNGGAGVFPGTGDITIEDCTFKTNVHCIYYEEARDNLVVQGNTFELADNANVILLRGNTKFIGNTVISGRTVNVVSGSPVVSGNDFNEVRFKVYNAATATISENEINNLAFDDDETPVCSAFTENILNEVAQNALNAITVAQIGTTKYGSLQVAINAAVNGDLVTLLTDNAENVTVTQKPDVKFTIDGAGKTMTGTITIDGKSAAYATAGITVKNMNFTAATEAICINLGVSGNNNTRYTSNVTVESCNFTGTDKTAVGIKSYTGGDKNLTVTACTATGMHSLMQLKNTAGVSVTECVITDSKNGISLGASSGVAINETTVDCDGYGVRADANGDDGNATITDCTIEAFIPVVIRKASNNYGLQFDGENTMTATNADGLWCAIGTSEYETNGTMPTAPTGDVTVTLNDTGLSMDGVYGEHFALNGEGTAESPYLINNLYELKGFRDLVDTYKSDGSNQFAGKYFKLTNDIDLSGINWDPIGTMNGDHGSFKGVFDGGDHTISNLHVEQAGKGIGLFARTTGNAVIKNLKLNNVTVKSTDNSNYVGGLVGNAYASTKIENVHVSGNVCISGRGYIGGIAGHGYVVMDNVSVVATGDGHGNDKGLITSTFWCAGGVLGYAGEGATNIKNAHVENVVVTSAAGGLGAIVGMAEDNNGTQPISGSNLSAKNVEIKTYTGAYGDSYANYALGYLYGGNPTSILTGDLSVDNVIIETSNGVAPEVNDAVAQIGNSIYFNFQAALNAAVENETITLLRDIKIAKRTEINNRTLTIDGNGKTIRQDENFDNTIAMFDINGGKVTIKNVTFDGVKKGAAVRTVYVEFAMDNVTAQNSEHTVGQGLFRLVGQNTITNSKFLNNNCSMVITLNYDEESNTPQLVENCLFEGNECNSVAALYYVKGAGCTIKDSEFVENTVNCNNNGATVYLGFTENNVVTGNIFDSNSVIDASTSARVAGAIFFGYEAEIENNVFVGNTASNANNDVLGQICTSTYYDCTIDLSGNYWGGEAPEYGKDYTIQHTAPEHQGVFQLDNYYKTFTTDENGNVELGDKVNIDYVAQVGKFSYETLAEAFTVAQENETITLLIDTELSEMITIPNGKTVVLDLNGKTITGTDNTTKNFSIIDNRGNLTITDSSDPSTGKITLTATTNSGWNRYSAVIANNPGGKLTIEAGTLEHLGGTDMAYGIDNLTNGKGTYAETVINGGYIKSTYRGIRQFLNGTEAQNILTVNGGTIEGANKSIWMQDPSVNANTGTLAVRKEANLIGDVYLYVTPNSTSWPVEVSIAAGALAEGSEIITGNVPAGYELQQDADGNYVVNQGVAKIGEVLYETLQEAINTVENNGTIVLIRDTDQNILAGNENLKPLNKVFTIDGDNHVVTGNWRFGRDDHNTDLSEITIKNVNFKGNGISILDFYKVTISECTFNDITTGNAIYVSADEYTSSIVVENCEMNNIEGAGINFRNPVNATVKGNKINGTGNNSITFQHGTAYTEAETGEYIIENNIFQNWANEASEGRALRIATGVKPRAITIENNVMIKDNAPEEFVKVTGNTDNVSVDENYWNGANPTSSNTPAYFLAEGVQVHNYYAAYDAESNTLSDLVTIEGAGETLEIFYTAAGEVTEQANAAYSLMFTVTDYARKEVSIKIGSKKPAQNSNINLVTPSEVQFEDLTFNVTSVANSGFDGTSFKKVTISEGVETIGNKALHFMSKLTELVLPSTLVSVGEQCIGAYNPNTLPLKSIVCYAPEAPFAFEPLSNASFQTCVEQQTILIVPNAADYTVYSNANGWKFTNILGIGSTKEIAGKDDKYTLLATVTSMNPMECSIQIGNTKPASNSNAELVIPETVTFFEGYKFNVTSIPNNAFSSCLYFVGDLVIPQNVRTIGASAFNTSHFVANETVRGTLTLNEGLVSIGSQAFKKDYFKGDLSIPSTVETIASNAFQYASFDGILTINGNIDCANAFGGTGFTELVLVEGVEEIKDSNAFSGMTELKEVVLPLTLQTVGMAAFKDDNAIEVIHTYATEVPAINSIPGNVNYKYAFSETVKANAVLYVHGTSYDDVLKYKNATNEWNEFANIHLYGAVAQIGEVEYLTIQDAINAAQAGETITVIDNVELTETITVAAGKEVVLDLNGKVVSYTTTEYVGEAMITNNGNLTINDSANGGKLSYAYEGGADSSYGFGNSTIENKGILTINAGTVQNTSEAMSHASYAINTGAGATLNVEGGNIINENGHAVRMVSFGTTLNTVNIEGGYIEGTRALQVQLPGSASAAAPEMELNITGGELKSNDETYNLAIYVYSSGQSAEDLTIKIEGGTFNGNVAIYEPSVTMEANSVVVSGGTFNGAYGIYTYGVTEADQAVISIVGGTFATNYSEWWATDDNYVFEQNENGTYSVVEQTIFTQTTQLNAGWNWFSAYVDIEGVHDEDGQTVYEGLTMIQNALGTNGIQIKKQGNFSTYEKDFETWFGNFAIYNKETLFINVTESQELTIVGEIVNPEDHTITLNPNWNWIGYPLNTTLLMSEAFEQAGLTPSDGDIVKHQDDFASYLYIDESTKGWIGDFDMNPGEGFMYMNNSGLSKQLTYKYPTNVNNRSEAKANVTTEEHYWTPNTSQYPNNMTMIAMVDVEGGDYEVAAFVDGEVRGSARPIYVEALDSYMLFLTIHGEGVEEMTFKFYDLATGEEYALNDRMNYSDNAIVGSIKEPYMFNRGTTGIGEASLSDINIYPNPTTTGKEINLQATCDKVEVFNALGVKVAEYQNVDSIDAIETAGIYVIRLTNNGNVKHCSLVVK